MNVIQKTFRLKERPRGFHLVTEEVASHVPELRNFESGVAQIFIQHTSASLCLNENADPDVRHDMETAMNLIAPENMPFLHTCEGPDDMPAHVKSALIGNSVSIPVSQGRFNLGTWQGIYLCEHRNHGGARRLVVTVLGC